MRTVDTLIADTLVGMAPPPKLTFSQWAREHFRLPERSSATPGRFRPWHYQVEMLDAMGDPLIERVTVMKSARIGYTKCMMATLAAYSANAPCAIILLVPTDDDARGFAVDEVEPTFEESPSLRGLIPRNTLDGRNNMTMKTVMGGGTIKILPARAPRNLRRHDAKVLLIDEADAMEVTAEGDPILLAEKRTMAHPDRKIVMGSTPTVEALSPVEKTFLASDQRFYFVPCPHCGAEFLLTWTGEHKIASKLGAPCGRIAWPNGEPERAVCICPHCDEEIEEKYKPQMIAAGAWRPLQPDVAGHAGFAISALYSLFANASWGVLACEFLQAKRSGPADLQVFVNTVLGETWRQTLDAVDERGLMARAEDFGIRFDEETARWVEKVPEGVLYITAGVDVQIDRLEVQFWGWGRQESWVLGHEIIWGATNIDSTWDELDIMLARKFTHPLGARIGISATGIDSGDGNRTQRVYDFCAPRYNRRVVAVKGMDGNRPWLKESRNRKAGIRLFMVGVDEIKTDLLNRLAMERRGPRWINIASHFDEEFYRQLTSERRKVEYRRGRPHVFFQRIEGRAAEALDCAVYANAVTRLVRFNFDRREAELSQKASPRRSLADIAKELNS